MGWLGVLDFRLLLLNVFGLLMVQSMTDVWVELRGPRFVVHRHSITLRCEHNVEPKSVYKVVFYKDEQRIMKFVQGRDPPFEIYNVSGTDIDVHQITPTSISLERMDFAASGLYACEIALETPLYSKISKFHEINVIVRQKYRPRIKIKHKKVSANEKLEATCHSAAAYPAPHLTWFINDIKVEEHLTTPHGTSKARHHHHGMPLLITSSSLRFPLDSLSLQPQQTVSITCLSTIPSYANEFEGFADVQNNTVTASVVQAEPTPTQLPVKIISPEMNISYRPTLNLALIVLSLVCYYSF